MSNDLNRRVATGMQRLIREFEIGSISLGHLVDGLEGSIRAMDPPLQTEHERRFFDLLTVLEEAYATKEEERYKAFIQRALEEIKLFLLDLFPNAEDVDVH